MAVGKIILKACIPQELCFRFGPSNGWALQTPRHAVLPETSVLCTAPSNSQLFSMQRLQMKTLGFFFIFYFLLYSFLMSHTEISPLRFERACIIKEA